jgi:protein-disulfide isomerase
MRTGEVKLFIRILGIAAVVAGIVIYPMIAHLPPSQIPVPVSPAIDRTILVPQWSRVKGDPSAPYTLVEFGDYQCPQCANAQPGVDNLAERFKDRLNYVFHYMKASDDHYNADVLAMAAAAADAQGKFWEMHRLLMKNQKALKVTDQGELAERVAGLAAQLKMDPNAFRDAFGGDNARQSVAREDRLGTEVRIRGTPHFYLISNSDGKAIMQCNNFEELRKWLDKPSNWSEAVSPRNAASPSG